MINFLMHLYPILHYLIPSQYLDSSGGQTCKFFDCKSGFYTPDHNIKSAIVPHLKWGHSDINVPQDYVHNQSNIRVSSLLLLERSLHLLS